MGSVGKENSTVIEWDLVFGLLAELETQQKQKVFQLARRLRPDLTAEDIRNPHDFHELSDGDWQYEDGLLAGIQSVAIALRATRNRFEER